MVRWACGRGGLGGAYRFPEVRREPPNPHPSRRTRSCFPSLDAGFGELCNLDARFRPYAKSLFGRAGLELDRQQASREVLAKLDASLGGFFALLSGCFLLPAATKALEFLVRRYGVHEHNVEQLLPAVLPYHGTAEFVRLLQLLRLQRTPWDFLSGVQRSGAAPPRAALAARCAQDASALALVAEASPPASFSFVY